MLGVPTVLSAIEETIKKGRQLGKGAGAKGVETIKEMGGNELRNVGGGWEREITVLRPDRASIRHLRRETSEKQ